MRNSPTLDTLVAMRKECLLTAEEKASSDERAERNSLNVVEELPVGGESKKGSNDWRGTVHAYLHCTAFYGWLLCTVQVQAIDEN